MLHADTNREKFIQKGMKEYLLCDDCEGLLSRNFESPFKRFWFDDHPLPSPMPEPPRGSEDIVTVTGFNYDTFKLFHLSVLWRASVSRQNAFRPVRLGPYEDKIRQLLLAGRAGPQEHYPIWGFVLVDESRHVVNNLITRPQVAKSANHAYYFCYAGCEFYFIVTDHPTPEDSMLEAAYPLQNGTMKFVVHHWTESNSYRIFMEQRRAQNRGARC
jgi:hypothetical protein